MNCSFCGTENREETRFCLACGAPLGFTPSQGMEPEVTILADDSPIFKSTTTPLTEPLIEQTSIPQEPEPVLFSSLP